MSGREFFKLILQKIDSVSLDEEISSQQRSFFYCYQDPPSPSGAVPAKYVIVPEEEFTVFVTIFFILLGTDKPGFGAYDDVRLGITG